MEKATGEGTAEQRLTKAETTRRAKEDEKDAAQEQDDDDEEEEERGEDEEDEEKEEQASKRVEKRKRRRKGRSARRRSAKRRAMEVAGEHGGNKNDDDDDDVPVSVADRHRTLPGALQRRMELFPEGGQDDDNGRRSVEENEWFGNEETAAAGGFVSFVPYFDPRDVRWLQRELGFLPGNAVRVAARKRRRSSNSSAADAKDFEYVACGQEPVGEWGPPVVLQLYPLAVRDIYAGGKSGRKFKSRKRGTTAAAAPQTCDSTATTAASTEKGATEQMTTTTTVGRRGASDADADDEGDGDDDDDDDESDNPTADVDGKQSNNEDESAADSANTTATDGVNRTSRPAKRDDWRTSDGTGVIEPFPTMYWLTDRCLRAAISRLELSQHASVRAMERRLLTEEPPRRCMEAAHGRYARQRWDLLTEQDRQAVQRRAGGWTDSIGPHLTGVAGIRPPKNPDTQPRSLKCLHAHAAHYLAGETDNVVGKWVMEWIANPQNDSDAVAKK